MFRCYNALRGAPTCQDANAAQRQLRQWEVTRQMWDVATLSVVIPCSELGTQLSSRSDIRD